MIRPLKSGVIATVSVSFFLILVLVINNTTSLLRVPVAGHLWLRIIDIAAFPFTTLHAVYWPLVKDNPMGITRIILDQLYFVLGPLFWGIVVFCIQRCRSHRQQRTTGSVPHDDRDNSS